MIQIKDKPSGDDYEKWKARALRRRAKDLDARKTGVKVKPHDEIWKELKKIFLTKVFHDKCAYCEGKHSDGFTLHVEHYRPKGAVTEERQSIDHPGYYWLAYEWHNLLLACANCNGKHSDSEDDEWIPYDGKMNEFRIAGQRVIEPAKDDSIWLDELQAEKPLLLNPYQDDPAEHIEFDDTGVPHPHKGSERGRETIKVCQLNREKLNEARREAAREKVIGTLIKLLIRRESGEPIDPDEPFFPSSERFSAWLNWRAAQLTEVFNKKASSGEQLEQGISVIDPYCAVEPQSGVDDDAQ